MTVTATRSVRHVEMGQLYGTASILHLLFLLPSIYDSPSCRRCSVVDGLSRLWLYSFYYCCYCCSTAVASMFWQYFAVAR